MSFSPINYSQQDPAWKSVKIGSSGETIGHVGCAHPQRTFSIERLGQFTDRWNLPPLIPDLEKLL